MCPCVHDIRPSQDQVEHYFNQHAVFPMEGECQSRLPDRILHMRESEPVSKVRLLQICLFKITCDVNDCLIVACCLSDLGMQEFLTLLQLTSFERMVGIGWR